MSQSSASQSVQFLEERLGVELIDRSVRPLDLTPAGEVYFEGCRELLGKFRRLEDRVMAMRDRVAGHVRIAAIYSVGFSEMDGKIRQFRERFPDADLDLRYLHPDQVYAGVVEDRFDLGLISFPSPRQDLQIVPWQNQAMVFAVSTRHRLAAHNAISPQELNGSDFVTFTEDLRIRRVIGRWFREVGLSVHVTHEFDNVESIKGAVAAGDTAVTLLPKATIEREIAAGALKAIVPDGVEWSRPLSVIHRSVKPLSLAARKFVELLTEDGSPPAESVSGAAWQTAAGA